jgi:hypothetical protein
MSACCELTALGLGVHPDVAASITGLGDAVQVMNHLRDYWARACPACRQRDLLPTASAVQALIERWVG